MPRIPQIGYKFPQLRGMSSNNKWTVVCNAPTSYLKHTRL